MGTNITNVSWNMVESLCKKISSQVKYSNGKTADHVIGLARGGLVPATIIANYNGVRTVISHGYHSYDEENQCRDYRNPHGVMYQDGVVDLMKGLQGGNILVVDDLCDEGITMKGMITRLEKKFHENVLDIRTAVLYCKSHSKFRPNYIGKDVDNSWIKFPWE